MGPGLVIFLLAGIVGGIAVGIGLAAITEFADQRLRLEEDFATEARLPVLGRVRASLWVPRRSDRQETRRSAGSPICQDWIRR